MTPLTSSDLHSRYWAAADGNERTEASSSSAIADEEITHFEKVVRPRPGMNAVELARGTGQWARRLAGWGLTVTGIDSCDEALTQAQAAGPHPGLTYMHWDIMADPIPGEHAPGRFDIVTCRYGLPSLKPGRLLTDAGQWLKPDGIFYALVRVGSAHGPADRRVVQTHPCQRLVEVSPFPGDASDDLRNLGVGRALREVHELGPRRRVIVLGEYGVGAGRCPSPAEFPVDRFPACPLPWPPPRSAVIAGPCA